MTRAASPRRPVEQPAPPASASDFSCQVCGEARLAEIAGFAALARVTSDLKPFPAGGRLTVCEGCGAAQKLPDGAWLAEISRIYAAYAMHPESGEVDQVVFDRRRGELRPRAAVLCDRLAELPGWRERGDWLDCGSGAGAMLSAASARFPAWSFSGQDLDARYRERLAALRGFRRFHDGPIEAVKGSFDLVSLIHSLEHFVSPHQTLVTLRAKLAPRGRLFIQVSDAQANPFDLVVADHLMHFDGGTLAQIVTRAGFEVETVTNDWVQKELSLVARPATAIPAARAMASPFPLRAQVEWLEAVLRQAQELARSGPIGIFGSSIAATWLVGCLGERVAFLVDENPERVGLSHCGRPILAPAEVPKSATVLVGLVPMIAAKISERLAPLGFDLRLPPPFPGLS